MSPGGDTCLHRLRIRVANPEFRLSDVCTWWRHFLEMSSSTPATLAIFGIEVPRGSGLQSWTVGPIGRVLKGILDRGRPIAFENRGAQRMLPFIFTVVRSSVTFIGTPNTFDASLSQLFPSRCREKIARPYPHLQPTHMQVYGQAPSYRRSNKLPEASHLWDIQWSTGVVPTQDQVTPRQLKHRQYPMLKGSTHASRNNQT
jgi:hypothetical protein